MPNWKTYESSVRLLSAIIAAHPDLKLNYDEVGKKYGGGTKYKAIWGRMAQIKENARLINEAIAHGIDPISVELADAPSRNSKEGQGSYVAVLIQSLLAQHDYSASPQFDPFTIDFDVYFKSETAKLFGGGVKYFAVWSVMAQINGHASALREAYDGGIDPFTVELNNETAARGKKKTQVLSQKMGSDCSASALENRFRRIKQDSKRINDAISRGVDPLTLGIGSCEETAHFYGEGLHPKALETHMYRHVKPVVAQLRSEVAPPGDRRIQGGGSNNALHRHLGSDTTPGALRVYFTRHITPKVQLIRDSVNNGVDPKDLNLESVSKLSEVQQFFGSDATASGIKFQFATRIKEHVKLLKQARSEGKDCKDVALSSGGNDKAVARTMGSDVTSKAIQHQIARLKVFSKAQLEALESGTDPKDVTPSAGKDNQDISKYFGKDSTPGGIGFQFRQIKLYAKSQKQCANSGGDPQTLGIGAGKGEEANGKAVANNFGQGITGKAVSERMLRMKKEDAWNLNINREIASTPRGKKATPKKKVEDDAQFVDDDEEDLTTPSKKKGPLNKVNNGRITKKKGGAGASAGSSFNDNIIKDEYAAGFNTPENAYGYNPANYDIQEFAREQVEENAVYYDNDDTEA
ncbi:hypothetical protein OIDMADRAFT_55547 [Oidiodendron maius Zn]|uniref:Uncharacterized protein n=1 Tax=Oidiodendron maius (strain Zn) TaxID=913774 RepID=A0A0C3DCI1_OIDMZ|nr:hypothetical protein OIDMADRAFT_55547 [Oidiodendron maius Zn]